VNNISSCLAQQSTPSSADAITMSTEPTDFPITNKAPRAVLIDQARQWALKALAHASTIKPPDRNEECDVGCTVATHNLGEFFEMEGKVKEARQKYEEAASLAKAMRFADGLANARAGLVRLKELEKKA
jgi:propanediol dehydratase small subunit